MSRSTDFFLAFALVVGLLVLVALWGTTRQAELDERRIETAVTANQVQLRLAACVQSRVDLVNTLAHTEWQSRAELLSRWTDQASMVFPILPGIQALNFVDPDWVIRRVYPEETNQAALNIDLTQNKNQSVLNSLPLAEASDRIVRTDIIDLLQSGKGFVLYRKIKGPRGETLGYVNGVFRVTDLMESCLAEEDLRQNFRFVVTESGGGLVYSRGAGTRPWQDEITLQVDVAGRPWNLVFAPTDIMLDKSRNYLTDFLVALIALLGVGVVLALRAVLKHQATLRESQDKYRLLVENQSDMVVKVNMDGEFTYVSPSYCEVFGKSEAELLNNQFMPLVHEDDRELTARSLEKLALPPHQSYHEQRAMTKEGWRWLAWSNKGILNEAGELVAITAMGRDVTETKALEERMAHTDKMKALGEMAGGITHDFNNLLQVMLGNLELLIEQPEKLPVRGPVLVTIRNAVQRAMQLTEKLAGLSRQQTLRHQVVDLAGLTRETTELMRRTLPESIELKLTCESQPLLVRADESQIEQVILNLFFNARDAITQNGHVELTLGLVELDAEFCRLHPELQPGTYVQLKVSDDGRGMPAEELSRVFEPFFTTKPPGAGTGLGLANCFSIVQQHSGIILATSVPFEGSTFVVYLPALSAEAEVEAEVKVSEAQSSQPVDQDRLGRTILVADDSDEVRQLTCMQLKQAGYDVIEAASGSEAITEFTEHADDIGLVILDVVMPGMDGQTAAAEIRKIRPGVALFFISGYSPEVAGYDSLPGTLLKKPFNSTELRTLVEANLGGGAQ